MRVLGGDIEGSGGLRRLTADGDGDGGLHVHHLLAGGGIEDGLPFPLAHALQQLLEP